MTKLFFKVNCVFSHTHTQVIQIGTLNGAHNIQLEINTVQYPCAMFYYSNHLFGYWLIRECWVSYISMVHEAKSRFSKSQV